MMRRRRESEKKIELGGYGSSWENGVGGIPGQDQPGSNEPRNLLQGFWHNIVFRFRFHVDCALSSLRVDFIKTGAW